MPPVQLDEPQQFFGLRGRKLSLEQLLGDDDGGDDGGDDEIVNQVATQEDAPQKSEVTVTLGGMLILLACLYMLVRQASCSLTSCKRTSFSSCLESRRHGWRRRWKRTMARLLVTETSKQS